MSIPTTIRSWLRIGALTCGFAMMADPGSAATASINYPPQAAFIFGAATKPDVIILPAAGVGAFGITLVLPADYDNNGKVEIVMLMQHFAVDGCPARIVPTNLFRYRAGLPFASGLSGVNGGNPIVNFAAGGSVVKKVVAIKKGTAMPGQRRGDALELLAARQADDVTDACPGDVLVRAIEIRYAVAP
jgi:hypothetical protein